MSTSNDRPELALLWMLISASGFAVMNSLVKVLSPELPHFEIVFFRAFINLLIVAVIVCRLKQRFFGSSLGLLLFRGLMGFTGLSCSFYTVGQIPLGVSNLLAWSSPGFVILFSALFLREKTSGQALAWAALAFAGLVLVVDPHWGAGSWQGLPLVPIVIGIVGAAAAGLAYVAVRAATATVGVQVIVFYFCLVSTVLSAPMAWLVWRTPNSSQMLELLILGISATLGQYGLTRAYTFAAAGPVSVMGISNVAFGATMGWLIFGERLRWTLVGGMTLLAIAIAGLALRGKITRTSEVIS